MKKNPLKLVVNNQPTNSKKKNLKKQSRKMECRIFRRELRSARGREEYLDGII